MSFVRRRWNPRTWSVRWRLAATSAALTLVILLLFGAVVATLLPLGLAIISIVTALAVVAIVVRHEIVLFIMGGLFVLETVSVILQVASYRLTGRRIFRMAPVHHHFELKGWPEPRVIVRFWILTLVLVLVGLSTLKLR